MFMTRRAVFLLKCPFNLCVLGEKVSKSVSCFILCYFDVGYMSSSGKQCCWRIPCHVGCKSPKAVAEGEQRSTHVPGVPVNYRGLE